MRKQCMNSDKQCMNSDPCEVTVHAQKKKKKKKKKRKTWKGKCSINLNPNTHDILKSNFITYNTPLYNTTYIKISIFLLFYLNNVSLLFLIIFFLSLFCLSLSHSTVGTTLPTTHQKPTTHTITTRGGASGVERGQLPP